MNLIESAQGNRTLIIPSALKAAVLPLHKNAMKKNLIKYLILFALTIILCMAIAISLAPKVESVVGNGSDAIPRTPSDKE